MVKYLFSTTIIGRASDEKSVGFFKELRGFVDLVLKDAAVVGRTVAAGDAAVNILFADLEQGRLNTLLIQSADYFIECGGSAAVCLRAAVDDQNIVCHDVSPFHGLLYS